MKISCSTGVAWGAKNYRVKSVQGTIGGKVKRESLPQTCDMNIGKILVTSSEQPYTTGGKVPKTINSRTDSRSLDSKAEG